MRRKLAGLVLLLGALWVGTYLLGASQRVVAVEIHYVLGDPPGVSRLQAVFRPEGKDEQVASFVTELISPEIVHTTRLPKGRHVVEISLGEGRVAHRTIDAERGAVIRLELAHEARAWP